MAFWGALVKYGEPLALVLDGGPFRRLRITQAIIDDHRHNISNSMDGTSRLYCKLGENSDICVCRFEGTQICHIDLQFKKPDKPVFRVIGYHDIHISGYYMDEFPSGYHIMPQINAFNTEDVVSSIERLASQPLTQIQPHNGFGGQDPPVQVVAHNQDIEATGARLPLESSPSPDHTQVAGQHALIGQVVAHVQETGSTSRSHEDKNVGLLAISMEMGAEQSKDVEENSSPMSLAIVVRDSQLQSVNVRAPSRQPFTNMDGQNGMEYLPELLTYMRWLLAKLPFRMNQTNMVALHTRTIVQETLQAYYRRIGCVDRGARSRLTIRELGEPSKENESTKKSRKRQGKSREPAQELNDSHHPSTNNESDDSDDERPISERMKKRTILCQSKACDGEIKKKKEKNSKANTNKEIDRGKGCLKRPRTRLACARAEETKPKHRETLSLPPSISCPSNSRDEGKVPKKKKKKMKTDGKHDIVGSEETPVSVQPCTILCPPVALDSKEVKKKKKRKPEMVQESAMGVEANDESASRVGLEEMLQPPCTISGQSGVHRSGEIKKKKIKKNKTEKL